MLSASLTDNRKAASKLARDLSPGDCFIYDGMLCMTIDAYEIAYDSDAHVYCIILTNIPTNKYIGHLVIFAPSDKVEPVGVEADFTIVE